MTSLSLLKRLASGSAFFREFAKKCFQVFEAVVMALKSFSPAISHAVFHGMGIII